MFDKLHGASQFSNINLRLGYSQVRIRGEDIFSRTFQTLYCLYMFQVMYFGLTNALVVIMDLMNWVFRDYLDSSLIIIFDDILVFSKIEYELWTIYGLYFKWCLSGQKLVKEASTILKIRLPPLQCWPYCRVMKVL